MERLIPFLPLSEAVDEFFGASIGSNRKYYANYLINAKWVAKKLFRETIYFIQHKYVKIDKTTVPHSVVAPKNMLRFFGASMVNSCGDPVSMRENEKMFTLPKLTGSSCTCTDCDCDGMCSITEQFTARQRDVTIANGTYQEIIWNKKMPNGDVVEIRRTPFQDYYDLDNWKISYQDQKRVLTTLEVKPCGCIVNSAENARKITSVLGFTNFCNTTSLDCFVGCNNRNGEFKVGKDGRIYLRNYNPLATHVILNFQTNGECPGEEMLIPEDAVDALHFGMIWRVKALSGANRLEVRESKRQYESMVSDLEMFRQPVLIEEFLEVQGILPKWGTILEDCALDLSRYQKLYTQEEVDQLMKTPVTPPVTVTPVVVVPPPPGGGGGPPVDVGNSSYTSAYGSAYK